jgi:hypothetical protein
MAWLYGLHNAARTYSNFIWPVGDSSMGLSQYHWVSLSELLMTSAMASNVDSKEDDGTWADTDFLRLNHLGTWHQSPVEDNYPHKGFYFDDESHDPSRECFMCDGEDHEGTPDEN